jgi:hypothetical protein
MPESSSAESNELLRLREELRKSRLEALALTRASLYLAKLVDPENAAQVQNAAYFDALREIQ